MAISKEWTCTYELSRYHIFISCGPFGTMMMNDGYNGICGGESLRWVWLESEGNVVVLMKKREIH